MPQLQFQHARSAKVPILQWCERLPSADQISGRGTRPAVRDRDPSRDAPRGFQDHDHRAPALREGVATACCAAADADQPVSRSAKWLIFVDDLAGELVLSERLRAIIREQNCTVRSLPRGAPLGNNGIDVKELLRPCRAGITIYTDRSKYATAYNRLVYFLNQIAEGSLPLARWGVYLQQGTVASEFGIESDDVVPINEHGLADFLRGL